VETGELAPSSPTFVYDANGRLTNDTFDTMSWDIEGSMVKQSGVTLAHDGLNHEVGGLNKSGSGFNYIYAPDDGLLAARITTASLQKCTFPYRRHLPYITAIAFCPTFAVTTSKEACESRPPFPSILYA
jgi:hypothetical protein